MAIYDNTDSATGISAVFCESDAISNVLKYFNRRTDRDQIRTAVKDLYATGLKTEGDPAKGDFFQTYTKKDIEKLIDSGQFETIAIGFGNKIINALATLFTEETQKYTLTAEGREDLDDAEGLLKKHREAGGYKKTAVRADQTSIPTGSAAILYSYDRHVTYDYLAPDAVRAFYNDYTRESAEGVIRVVNQSNIEDASYIICRLGQVGINVWNYLAIYNRRSYPPFGRYVIYQAGNTIEVPEPFQNGAQDHKIDGVFANPLSYYAAQNPDKEVPEFPLSIIYSSLTQSQELFPITTSLHANCLEFSRAASHLLSTSQDAAVGAKIIERDPSGTSQPLPTTSSGPISMPQGHKFRYEAFNDAASKTAYDVLRAIMIDVAAAYSVPDYMVVSEDYTYDAASGIALQVKTRPYKKFRQFRADENAESIRRGFLIEKSLIDQHDNDPAASQLAECDQTWDPGEVKLPENKLEMANRIAAMMDKGVMDTVEAIREYYQLRDTEEALEFYDRMKERQGEYPPLKEEPKQKPGLFRNRQQQQ